MTDISFFTPILYKSPQSAGERFTNFVESCSAPWAGRVAIVATQGHSMRSTQVQVGENDKLCILADSTSSVGMRLLKTIFLIVACVTLIFPLFLLVAKVAHRGTHNFTASDTTGQWYGGAHFLNNVDSTSSVRKRPNLKQSLAERIQPDYEKIDAGLKKLGIENGLAQACQYSEQELGVHLEFTVEKMVTHAIEEINKQIDEIETKKHPFIQLMYKSEARQLRGYLSHTYKGQGGSQSLSDFKLEDQWMYKILRVFKKQGYIKTFILVHKEGAQFIV